jgi:hypothetical protein
MFHVMGRHSGEAAKGTHKRSLRAIPLDGVVRPNQRQSYFFPPPAGALLRPPPDGLPVPLGHPPPFTWPRPPPADPPPLPPPPWEPPLRPPPLPPPLLIFFLLAGSLRVTSLSGLVMHFEMPCLPGTRLLNLRRFNGVNFLHTRRFH